MSRKRVDSIYSELQKNAKSASVRAKLLKIHNACEQISANAIVSIASVINYISSDGVKLTKRTVYNDRAGGNPYKTLIEEWIRHSEVIQSERKSKPNKVNSETSLSLIDEDDLAKISDIALRHKFSLMYGELRSLRNQVNILKDVSSLPTLTQPMLGHESSDDDLLPHRVNSIELTDYEREVCNDFFYSKSTPLDFDEDGSLVSKSVIRRNETLSMEGFKAVLEKLLNNGT